MATVADHPQGPQISTKLSPSINASFERVSITPEARDYVPIRFMNDFIPSEITSNTTALVESAPQSSSTVPFWFGAEDETHIHSILQAYMRLLHVENVRPKNSRQPIEFVGRIERRQLKTRRLRPRKQQLTASIEADDSTTHESHSSSNSNSNSNIAEKTEKTASTSASKPSFETLDEVAVYQLASVPLGYGQKYLRSEFVRTTWDVEDGIPMLCQKISLRNLDKWRTRIIKHRTTPYLYCLPQFNQPQQTFKYLSDSQRREVGYASSFSHCIYNSFLGVGCPLQSSMANMDLLESPQEEPEEEGCDMNGEKYWRMHETQNLIQKSPELNPLQHSMEAFEAVVYRSLDAEGKAPRTVSSSSSSSSTAVEEEKSSATHVDNKDDNEWEYFADGDSDLDTSDWSQESDSESEDTYGESDSDSDPWSDPETLDEPAFEDDLANMMANMGLATETNHGFSF